VAPDDLFSAGGSALLLGVRSEPRHGLVSWLRDQWVRTGWIGHAPNLIRRDIWLDMLERHPDQLQTTRANRFRDPADLRFHILYRAHRLDCEGAVPVPGYKQTRFVRLHRIENDLLTQTRELARVRAMKPRFFCLNDDQGDEPSREVQQLVRRFLDDYFPQPSSFEA
jgi:hypothetical protein